MLMSCWSQEWLEKARLSLRWPQSAPRWAQEGSRNYLAGFCRCSSPLFGPILGPSWAILGPPWPFLGGPGGHLEADFGLGRLASGVQGGEKLRCQKFLKIEENQCVWPISGDKEPSEGLQNGCLEVLLWAGGLEESNLEAVLASNLVQQGEVELKFKQT